jgi:hypothetical protein
MSTEDQAIPSEVPTKVEGKKAAFAPFVCTPAYGGVLFVPYAKALLELSMGLIQHGIATETFFMVNESLIPRARNNCVAEFMKRPYATHLIFIDADVGFEAQHVVDMIQADLPIVGGIYPKKTVDWEQILRFFKSGRQIDLPQEIQNASVQYVVNFHDFDAGRGEFRAQKKDGKIFLGVKELPTGFMCIRRDTIEKMYAAYPERAYACDSDEIGGKDGFQRIDLFGSGPDPFPPEGTPPEKRRYLSEDWYFSRLASRIGIESWAYTGARLTHTGNMTFMGDFGKNFIDYHEGAIKDGKNEGTPGPQPPA